MSTNLKIKAQLRADEHVGTSNSRKLRRQHLIPGVFYGAGKKSQNLSFAQKELEKVAENESFLSQIVDVTIDGKANRAVVKELQRHPVNSRIMHIDFQRVSAKNKINVTVPIHFLNEETCAGVKLQGGLINHHITEVEVSCLPKDLPEFIELNVAEIKLGEIVHLSNLVLPQGVDLVALLSDETHDSAVFSVSKPRGVDEGEETSEEESDATDEEENEES